MHRYFTTIVRPRRCCFPCVHYFYAAHFVGWFPFSERCISAHAMLTDALAVFVTIYSHMLCQRLALYDHNVSTTNSKSFDLTLFSHVALSSGYLFSRWHLRLTLPPSPSSPFCPVSHPSTAPSAATAAVVYHYRGPPPPDRPEIPGDFPSPITLSARGVDLSRLVEQPGATAAVAPHLTRLARPAAGAEACGSYGHGRHAEVARLAAGSHPLAVGDGTCGV